ncbi:hypothetical protein ACF9IK_05220 [Kitasatospora hibisci]|uniref:hypothetical protein n=1 Tax=Kitasatospora hibisci TaxID=3369522 RepID=UPI0037553629
MKADDRARLEAELAERAVAVPGVAYLSPNLLRRLTGRGRSAGGVRIRDGDPPVVEVWIAVRTDHQAAATARAVRGAVRTASAGVPGLCGAQVRVVVSATA